MNTAFSDIIGHKKQCSYLSHVLDNQSMAHAYCFLGSKSLGKATIAKRFAAQILGVDTQALQSSPNVVIVESGATERRGISIEQIRELKQRLSLSTFGTGWKVAIIDGADQMTVAAQNALLKTLEEPTQKTAILLISHKANALLETIQSRVVTVSFSLLPQEEITQMLQGQENTTKEQKGLCARMAMGRPGKAILWQDEELRNTLEEDSKKSFQFLQDPLYARMKVVEEITKRKEERQQVIENMIELWRMWLHESLWAHVQGGESISAVPVTSALQAKHALQGLQHCEYALSRNVQPALALQVFASSF